jgi:membrane protein YqaA with SNARE-associated domain
LNNWAIFWICFLAATVLPIGSEPAVGAVAALEEHVWELLVVASMGNYMGALANYAAGRWGRAFYIRHFFGVESEKLEKAEKYFHRWGTPVLFFAWLPIIGDPLTILAGVLKIHPLIFTLWVLPGKMFRYYIIIKGVEQWRAINPSSFII